jgi:hypothetical protein
MRRWVADDRKFTMWRPEADIAVEMAAGEARCPRRRRAGPLPPSALAPRHVDEAKADAGESPENQSEEPSRPASHAPADLPPVPFISPLPSSFPCHRVASPHRITILAERVGPGAQGRRGRRGNRLHTERGPSRSASGRTHLPCQLVVAWLTDAARPGPRCPRRRGMPRYSCLCHQPLGPGEDAPSRLERAQSFAPPRSPSRCARFRLRPDHCEYDVEELVAARTI